MERVVGGQSKIKNQKLMWLPSSSRCTEYSHLCSRHISNFRFLILSFWNDSIFYIFLGAFPHLVGWMEAEGETGEGESGRDPRVGEGERPESGRRGEWKKRMVGETGELLQENLNLKSKI